MYDNIDIFILTYNRADLIYDTLISVCNQSAKGFDIYIVDNASTDNTKEVVEQIKQKYPERNIILTSAEKNEGFFCNFNRAVKLANKKWAILFHDDDLMHTEYIKNAMDILADSKDAVMAGCEYTPLEHPDNENWENLSKDYFSASQKDFAALLFSHYSYCFPSAIYRTDILKKVSFNLEYGKITDRPFLMEVNTYGKHILFKAPYIRYRVHNGQDTLNHETDVTKEEWTLLLECYKKILGENLLDKYDLLYKAFIFPQLAMGYNWSGKINSQMTFREFRQYGVKKGLICKFETSKITRAVYAFFAKYVAKIHHNNFIKAK